MKNALAIIPARFASTRFPGKPLQLIAGKSMVQRVYEQALKCDSLSGVLVATDDSRIEAAVLGFGGKVVMTSPDCQSGTDRCAEVLQNLEHKPDIILNIQGDEPFVQPEQIGQLVLLMKNEDVQIGTLCKAIQDPNEVFNPNVVKLVKSISGRSLYFSRSAIPFVRDEKREEWCLNTRIFKHVGMYGYRAEVLGKISKLPVGQLEKAENLEQLRWLEAGFTIWAAETDLDSFGLDTPEDFQKAEEFLKNATG